MTNEEAIEILREIKEQLFDIPDDVEKAEEALGIAINSIQKQMFLEAVKQVSK